jgi:hypothetical protein
MKLALIAERVHQLDNFLFNILANTTTPAKAKPLR